jgi:hypothetical protein
MAEHRLSGLELRKRVAGTASTLCSQTLLALLLVNQRSVI